jgi:hypothetical protein
MRNIVFLVLSICTSTMFAQSEIQKKTFELFQANYNAENYEEIFNSFSANMQNALPIENTKQFLTGLKSQVGKIIDKEFISSKDESQALYKTQFERAVLGVYISLDDKDQMSGLLIKPYEEPKKINTASNNGLSEYPTQIAEVIFSKTKNLPNKAQLSIAAIQNGKTNYYGVTRDDSTIKPIENQNKIFEIGSIT